MTPRKSTALSIGLFSLALTSPALPAQTIAPNSTQPTIAEAEKAIELSPFVVNSTKDTGYQATSTLAGTRLNTPVKDLGASISIYTKDFLNDIGATNANELLIYATGMEAAGPGGNFSGATNDISADQVNGNAVRANPQQNGSRTRGLSAPSFSRGFYTTDIATDSYNVESVTVNRGPNAILFGVGSPAGFVESALLRPNLRRNNNKVEIRAGNNGALRNTVDFNRVLLKDKLALRLAALHDEERYNQRPAFEEKKRIYGALAFEPYKSTALRLNFETGRTKANRPITVLPFNSISSFWEAAGRPGYDWSFYDDPARNPNAAAQIAGSGVANTSLPPFFLGTGQIFDQIVQVYSSPTATAPNFAFRGQTLNTNGNAANVIKNQVFNPLVNRDLAADAINFLTTVNLAEHPVAIWNANVLPGQQPGFAPAGIKMQGFTDFSAFDFKNRLIDESSRQGDTFHAFNLAFEQRAWEDRIGLELAYDTQRVDRRSKNSAFAANNGNHVRIDINAVLPTGQPNPNFGRPFVAAYNNSSWRNNFTDRETRRATGFLKYDFKDIKSSWGKWLGRHTLTGLYEENAVESVGYGYRLAVDGAAARAISPNISVFARRAVTAIYLGPSIVGNNNPLQLEPIRVPVIQAGPLAVPAAYFVRAANATDPGHFEDAPASLVEINEGGNTQRDVTKSQAFLMQSYWLQDHLITLVGWRRDENFFVRESFNFVSNPADLSAPGKVHYGFNDFSLSRTPPPNVAAETMTYSGVLRWPQKLIRLPAGVDFGVFYNQSANFTPSGGRVTPFNEPLASPNGKTQEYGLNLSLFHDKLSLRVNRFETKVQGQSLSNTVFGLTVNNAILQIADFWGVEGNINPQLVPMREADIALLFSPLPANFRELYGWGITGTAPNLAALGRFSNLPGATDTTDFVAKGTEIELVYNPTRNWRILANVAQQETVQNNTLPFLKGLIGRMLPVWNQLRDRSRTNYPVGWQPGDSMAGIQTFGSWLDTVILVPFATAIATEGTASAEQRKWRANLITNYTFGSGSILGERLKGWEVGGAVRWQDKLGIGYPTTRNPDGSVNLDLAHPFYAPAETNVDAWIGYRRNLWKNRIQWKVQLRATNLIAGTVPIAIGVQPWGEFSTVRLAPEKRWYLTNTFSF
ncbi:MAG: TonB-dependent receptor plug domain-containing protein [Opitutaceae bacterium]|nr:TonB-dependent receptor plug domain-containing protein [Opitutaceae bacterium]